MVTKPARLYPIFVSCAAVLLFILPYWLAYRAETRNLAFSGFLINTQDGNSYLAKMYQGWQGSWLFTLPFTAESGEGAFLFGYYLLLGHVARVLRISLVATYHIARLLSAMALLGSIHCFLKLGLQDQKSYRLAFFVAIFGSGMGWLALPTGAFTADFWVAEGYPFLSGLANPHFPLALAILLSLLAPEKTPGTASILKSVPVILVSSFVLSVISPFGVVLVLGIKTFLVLWQLLERKSIRSSLSGLIAIGSGGLPLLIYDLWVTQTNPMLASWNSQNITPSPPIWDTLISFSPTHTAGAGWMLVGNKDEEPPVATCACVGLHGFVVNVCTVVTTAAVHDGHVGASHSSGSSRSGRFAGKTEDCPGVTCFMDSLGSAYQFDYADRPAAGDQPETACALHQSERAGCDGLDRNEYPRGRHILDRS